jgi:GrpB-like predicted nucleotidyltransferase (UPF0157 family)
MSFPTTLRPSLFDRERAALEQVLAPWLAGPIEHVGSTAVRGLTAKPVIDIMAAVKSLTRSRPAIEALRSRSKRGPAAITPAGRS